MPMQFHNGVYSEATYKIQNITYSINIRQLDLLIDDLLFYNLPNQSSKYIYERKLYYVISPTTTQQLAQSYP